MRRAQWIAAALALAAAPPAAAAGDEEPEAVYAKFHRAILAGDAEEMLRHGIEAQRAQMAAMSAGQKSAQVKLIGALMPPTYELRAKVVAPAGQSARLFLSGPGKALAGGKPETLYATVFMVLQRAEWKVAAASWSNRDPGIPAQASSPKPNVPAAPAAAQQPAAAQKAPLSTRSTPMVGTIDSGPERKLGKQKPACEFKPVMTAEDLENCK